MACQQFDLVADFLEIPDAERARIKYPKRSMTVALPIHCDDGSTKVFAGYRVQHHLTLGPTKGGLRYHPSVTLGESGCAGDVDELEVRTHGLAFRRSQRRHHVRTRGRCPTTELERLTRALYPGDDPVYRAASGCHGARSWHE